MICPPLTVLSKFYFEGLLVAVEPAEREPERQKACARRADGPLAGRAVGNAADSLRGTAATSAEPVLLRRSSPAEPVARLRGPARGGIRQNPSSGLRCSCPLSARLGPLSAELRRRRARSRARTHAQCALGSPRRAHRAASATARATHARSRRRRGGLRRRRRRPRPRKAGWRA
jgi:hypothetical protein